MAEETHDKNDESLRTEIRNLLTNGIETTAHPRPDKHEEVQSVIQQLHDSDGNLTSRLTLADLPHIPSNMAPIPSVPSSKICTLSLGFSRKDWRNI